MITARRTFAATSVVALLATAGVTAAIAADPAPDGPPAIAFLANGRVPADALAAGPIAGQLGAPIYTTEQASLSPEAAAALDAGDPELVIVLGGTVAIADAVVDQVADATGLTETDAPTPDGGIIRAAGPNRFATATAVANLLAAYDPAYLPVGNQAIDADTLDGHDSSAFLPADGTTTVTSMDWRSRAPDNFPIHHGGTVLSVDEAAGTDTALTLNPHLPTQLGDGATRLTGMQVCVDGGGSRIQEVGLYVSQVASDGARTYPLDETVTWEQGDNGCQTVTPATPVVLGPDRTVGAGMRVDTTGSILWITKTTLTLQGRGA